MTLTQRLYLGIVATALIAGAAGCARTGADVDRSAGTHDGEILTPLGVAMQPLGKAQGYDLGRETASFIARDQIAFTDLRGLTLYTREDGAQGDQSCADCAMLFKPFLAQPDARASGEWSLIDHPEGGRQWALNGKTLYTYIKDIDPGSVRGESPATVGARRLNGAGVMVGGGNRGDFRGNVPKSDPMPSGWKPALAFPMADFKLPAGISLKEVPDAAAFVLVDRRNHTLYWADPELAVDASSCVDEVCKRWQALLAPQLSTEAVGEFAAIKRTDGVHQWTYKGRPLFTFDGDLAPGFANGTGVDDRWSVAAIRRYFMPSQVSIQITPGQGKVLATSAGMTLYRRDGHILQTGGGHSLRRGQPARPAVGRDIGIDPRCGQGCEQTWLPFVADDDAKSSGFWSVAQRPDGKKQWVYQGYALWTFAGDKKPGDVNGHDSYDVVIPHDPNILVDVGTPMDGGAGLWWSIAVP